MFSKVFCWFLIFVLQRDENFGNNLSMPKQCLQCWSFMEISLHEYDSNDIYVSNRFKDKDVAALKMLNSTEVNHFEREGSYLSRIRQPMNLV